MNETEFTFRTTLVSPKTYKTRLCKAVDAKLEVISQRAFLDHHLQQLYTQGYNDAISDLAAFRNAIPEDLSETKDGE